MIRGKLRGGRTKVEGRTSIYTSTLLLNCARGEGDTELVVENPQEKPYVEMTLNWLDKQGIKYERDGFVSYVIPGGQCYRPFKEQIPGDFSTATFFLCGAAITNSDVLLRGLDMNDTQGDKQVVHFLQAMGADIRTTEEGLVIKGGNVVGPNLRLLSQYFAGYTVTVRGAFIAFSYSFFWGFLFGWLLAYLRNLFLALYIYGVKRKAELLSFKDFFDHL